MRIQELAQNIHKLIVHHNLPDLMYRAFEVLPTMVMTPYAAFQKELHGMTEEVYLDEMVGRINANMILPYPPGVPLVMPGEMITEESRPVLEFLQMLCEIGAHYPGFETDIHGAYRQADGRYTVKVLKEESKIISVQGKWFATSLLLIRRTHENTSQPRAIYYIVAIQIWEYFSFTACVPYSFSISPISLVLMITMPSACSAHMLLWFTLPLFSAAGADRLLGNRTAVIAGALLMTLGHVVLGIDTNSTFSLYLALAIIICGYGLFKSNISCLLGELYDENDHRRDGGFRCCMLRAISVLSPRPSPAARLLSGMDGMLALPLREAACLSVC